MIRLRELLNTRRMKQLWYLPLLGAAMGLMMLRILVMARVLDLPGFGTFSAGLLISSTFCMLGCLGLQSMLQRDMPVMLLRRRYRAAVILLTQCVMVALLCAMLGALASGFVVTVGGLPSLILAAGVVHGLSQQIFLLVTVESRSRGDPVAYAFQNFWRSLLVLCIGWVVASQTGSAAWVLTAEAAVSLVLSYAIVVQSLRRVSLTFLVIARVALLRLGKLSWRTALVLFLVSIVGFLHLNLDRWVAAQALPPERFALYAFAAIVLTVAQSVQSMVNASIYPMLARRFATAGLAATFHLSAKISIAMLAGALVLGIPGLFIFDQIIEHWFADYRSTTTLLVIFFGIAMLRVSDFWSSFLLISGHETRLLALTAAVLAGGAAGWALYVRCFQNDSMNPTLYGMLGALLAVGHYVASAAMAWHILRQAPTPQPSRG